jgi:metal-responsive CopG/Arc/MetJ family transcriptional regulator
MPNLTIVVPEELRQRMKRYPEVRWSEVIRRAVREYLDKLHSADVTETSNLAGVIDEAGIDLDAISVETAITHYAKMRDSEWRRLSTTRAS